MWEVLVASKNKYENKYNQSSAEFIVSEMFRVSVVVE